MYHIGLVYVMYICPGGGRGNPSLCICLGLHMLPWATVVSGPLTVWEGQLFSLVLV